jgi:NADPH:quinone reductase
MAPASILACSNPEEATMKAIVFAQTGGPEVLTLAEVPKPDVRPGMVLIRVQAIGVNFADTRFRQGTYVAKPKLPDTPGMEAAGLVEAVGDGVTGVRPGARVAAFTVKAYAEYCQAPESMVLPLPDSIDFVQGAAFPIQVLTAYHMLHTADTTGPGRTVLVHSAAGGVGLAAVQLAKAAGARAFGTVSSDAKRALAREHGADAVINYTTEKFADEVLRLTDGRGVDLILDAVGKPTFEEGLRCLAALGHLVLYGRAGGPTDPLNIATLSAKSQKVSGFMIPTITRNFPDRTRESAERCFALMRDGRLRLHIGRTFPLAAAADAHRFLESRQSTGKLILLPDARA